VLDVRSSVLEERITQAPAVAESAEEAPDEEATTLDVDLEQFAMSLDYVAVCVLSSV
jgi:hypothetical protein